MRVLVEPERLAAGELAVRGDEHHYLGRVRRARVGDPVELFDGAGRRAAARIVRMTDTETVLQVAEPTLVTPTLPHVTVLLPLLKGDRMDYALEKLVETGVDRVVVWPASRSVVKLEPDRRDARAAKYRAALQAAARQSGRAGMPTLEIAADLAAALALLAGDTTRLVLDPASDTPLAPTVLAGAGAVAIASGPEGGITPLELDRLLAAAFAPIGLGPRILRAETAPVIAVALVRALTHS